MFTPFNSFFGAAKLEKLTIQSFEDRDRIPTAVPLDGPVPDDTFVAMFNPESYSRNCSNSYNQNTGAGQSGSEAEYSKTNSETLSFKLILDSTHVGEYQPFFTLLGPKEPDVYEKVEKFLKLAYKMEGKKHKPRFLTISWGELSYKCVLRSININYTLFDQGGRALRAELDTTFLHDITDEEREQEDQKSSPDLTHYRVIGAHDRLPLMCEAIYGSPDYYVAVAKVNNLENFRDLKPGQEMYFPPIEK